ncbi:helix-turn-helix domain-containing protein [Sutterella wadsworthensis]|uniref:helix-turn-helix domain-containing protein n=1 Tax=Sutterella wadsworthensis TaxID=40545 RepID=UPI003A8DDF6B
MSIAAINWVAKQRVGNSNAKALLFWLAFHHNAETGLCCPGIKTLQAEMEVGSVNTVRTAMRLLKKLGFITAQPELKNGAIYRTLYTLNLDRISAEAPAIGDRSSQVEPPSVNEGGAIDVGGSAGDPGEGQQMTRGGSNGGRGEGQQVTPNREIEQGINRERNREVMCAPSGNSSANAAVASAQAQTPYPEDFDQSLFDEAMLATQDSEQAPEALPDPDADLPPKKQRRSQQPRVPFPETLPDDWAEAAKIARPDIDPQRVFLKLRARYAPTTTKKTLATWKREFMNWIGKEFAYDNRYRSSAQKPQRTLGATDTRSLNHRNFGKWASHAV